MKPEPKLILKAIQLLDDQEKEAKRMLAEDKWKDFDGIFTQELKIDNKYKGYVASFGGSVVQMGIMPACMAFIADKNRKNVTDLMFDIYRDEEKESKTTLEKFLKANWRGWNPSQRKTFRMKFTKAAVSLKLAMRTFEFDKGELSD